MWKALCCILVLVLSAALLTAPAQADNWADNLGAAIIGAPNEGGFFGAALTYQATDHLWADFGVKRSAGRTNPFIGASTDLRELAVFLGRMMDYDFGVVPSAARVGAGYGLVDTGAFMYLSYGISF